MKKLALTAAASLFAMVYVAPPLVAQLYRGSPTAHVADNAALLIAASSLAAVIRDGFYIAGDGGRAPYAYSASNCSLNSGAGDNGKQVPASGGGCWLADFGGMRPTPFIWGAHGDGTTADAAFITAALNSGIKTLYIPETTFRLDAGITVPDNVNLEGLSFQPIYPVTGSVLQCDLAVTPCVTQTNNSLKSGIIRGVTISRAAGTVPAGSIGLLTNGSNTTAVEDVMTYRHAIGVKALGNGANGIYLTANRLYTCGISDAHFVADTFAGVRVSQSQLGCNGSAGVNSNAFVRVQGNWDAVAGTIAFTNSQFNQGSNTAVCAVAFQNFTGTTNVVLDFTIAASHVETAQNGICSDSTVKGITNLQLATSWWGGGWGGNNHFFADISNGYAAGLNPATTINTWQLNGLSLTGYADVTLAPTAQINDLKITGSSLLMPLNITAAGNSTVDLTGNTYDGLTLAGSVGAAVITGTANGGTYSVTASGSIQELIPGQPVRLNLPTACTGLPTGALRNNAGVVNVC